MDKKKIFLVSLGHLSCDVNSGAIPAIIPFLIAAHGFSYQAAAGLMFAFSCLSSVIQPIFGYLADKKSKPWFIPLGVFMAGMGVAAIGFLDTYWSIFAAIAVTGFGAALFHPEGARYVNTVSGASKGAGMSLFAVGGNGGFVVGPLLAATAMSTFGLKGTAVFGALAVLTVMMLLYQILRMKSLAVPAKGAGHATAETGSNNWPEFFKLMLVTICRSITFVCMNIFIPLYLVNSFGQTKAAAALALTMFCSVGVCCNFVGGILGDRFGYVRLIRIGYLLLIPTMILLGQVSNLYLFLALLVPLGFSIYGPFSSMVVLGQRYLCRNIGLASGVTLGLATSAGGVMAPLLGWVADGYGLQTAIQVLGGVAVLGSVVSFSLNPLPRTKQAEEADEVLA